MLDEESASGHVLHVDMLNVTLCMYLHTCLINKKYIFLVLQKHLKRTQFRFKYVQIQGEKFLISHGECVSKK
jgi:hypothetical protein